MLRDGTFFEGRSVGRSGTAGGEICFNTGMTGYQEIYTDPSYFGQIIVNTVAHIGNYGVHFEEQESRHPQISGMVCGSFSQTFSESKTRRPLHRYLDEAGVVGISDIDTRSLVEYIRSKGDMNAVISSEISDLEALKEEAARVPSMFGLELCSNVSADKIYEMGDASSRYRVAVLDLGIKKSILDRLVAEDAYCRVYPAQTPFEVMHDDNPDGFLISNGPGDPAATTYAVETVRKILDQNIPLFGICMGHQILALASDISTYKMHHGHRGLNHPVKNLLTGKSEITSQNHGFAVRKEDVSKSKTVEITHINLNDDTVEGLRRIDRLAFSVQYHPEASPGPHDSRYLFKDFLDLMRKHKN